MSPSPSHGRMLTGLIFCQQLTINMGHVGIRQNWKWIRMMVGPLACDMGRYVMSLLCQKYPDPSIVSIY